MHLPDTSPVDLRSAPSCTPTPGFVSSYSNAHHTFHQALDPLQHLSVASWNVRGLTNATTATNVFNSIFRNNLSIVGLSETKLKPAAALNNSRLIAMLAQQANTHYQSWWNCDVKCPHGAGVGLILHYRLAKHVHKVTGKDGRYIYADLYFKGSIKLRIINIYLPMYDNGRAYHISLQNDILHLVSKSEDEGFKVIILGDFNLDPDKYDAKVCKGSIPSKKFSIIERLRDKLYHDVHPYHEHNDIVHKFHTFASSTAKSRIDLIWFPVSMIDQISFVEIDDLTDEAKSDHLMIVVYFSAACLFGHVPIRKIKQRRAIKKLFDYDKMDADKWSSFSEQCDATLENLDLDYERYDDSEQQQLNYRWHFFLRAVRDAAKLVVPTKIINTRLKDSRSDNMLSGYSDIRYIGLILKRTLRYQLKDFSIGPEEWSSIKDHINKLAADQEFSTEPLFADSFRLKPSNYNKFKKRLIKLKSHIVKLMEIEENRLMEMRIKKFSDERCVNFHSNQAKFISSSLDRKKRSIILDRVMISTETSTTLLTEPDEIKAAVNQHFQSAASIPADVLPPMSSKWEDIYSPIWSISPTIYDGLLDPITDDEWMVAINSLPLKKASGPTGISYEMLKHLGPLTNDLLRNIINTTFSSGLIPADWKHATVYPIPKPHEWESYLKNTRPITLLETARKLSMKLLNKRLSYILQQHHVLKGSNFAGLPGGSCQTPIKILESLIADAKLLNKPLYILSQDLSKAFDSIDTRMLERALKRLKIPAVCTNLLLQLSSDRTNRVITSFGLTDPYEIKVGIDQGEVVSPLLWVIYIDPLLTALNNECSAPYITKSDFVDSIPTSSIRTSSQSINNLTYMDDSTLISSSIEGLTEMLNVAQEFYLMNNTQANPNKYILISNMLKRPTVVTFNTTFNSFSITSRKANESFRFLGVWFSFSPHSTHIHKQIKTEYSQFNNIIRRKQLTYAQLAYLHNRVILPKVSYRAQITYISENQCRLSTSGFLNLFKQKCRLVRSIPNCLLFVKEGPFRLIKLFDHLISLQCASFLESLNSESSILRNIYNIRLELLQQHMWLPYSPLSHNDFSFWTNLRSLKNDFVAQTLAVANSINISFHSNAYSNQIIKGGFKPLVDYLGKAYGASVPSLRKRNILFFEQLVTCDGRKILSWDDINSRFPPPRRHSHKQPEWYDILKDAVTMDSTTDRLDPAFCVDIDYLPSPVIPIIGPTPRTRRDWVASWSSDLNRPLYGRVIDKKPNDTMVIEHWLPYITTTATTPTSNPPIILPCQGCNLKHRSQRPRVQPFACEILVPISGAILLPLKKNTKTLHGREAADGFPLASSLHEIAAKAKLNYDDTKELSTPSFSPILAFQHPLQQDFDSITCNIFNSDEFKAAVSFFEDFCSDITDCEVHAFTDGSYINANSAAAKMGCGWTISNSYLSTSFFTFNCSISLWPSSSRAEIAAVYTLLAALPHNIELFLYIDNQGVIDNLTTILVNDLSTVKLCSVRKNYLFWSGIRKLINEKHLTITLTKVKGHNKDDLSPYKKLNDLADSEAKKGNYSSNQLVWTDYTSSNSVVATFNSLPIELSLRSFVQFFSQLSYHNSFIQLTRFNNIFTFVNEHAPDWKLTWSNLSYFDEISKCETSFRKQSRIMFTLKLFLDELPTLEILRIRNAATYDNYTSCLLCSVDMESLDHVWTCIGIDRHPSSLTLSEIIRKTHDYINSISSSVQAAELITRHYVWFFHSQFPVITLGWFIRGFVPISFVLAVDKALSHPQVHSPTLSNEARVVSQYILFYFQMLLKQHRWLPRCDLFCKEEELAGISTNQKHFPSHYSSVNSAIKFDPLDNHSGWAQKHIQQGGNPLDFMFDVNSVTAAFAA
jgi:exonuclease III